MGLSNIKEKKVAKKERSTGKRYLITFLDKIYEDIKLQESVKIGVLSLKYNISVKETEKWLKLLQRQGLIKLFYPPFGETRARIVKDENGK